MAKKKTTPVTEDTPKVDPITPETEEKQTTNNNDGAEPTEPHTSDSTGESSESSESEEKQEHIEEEILDENQPGQDIDNITDNGIPNIDNNGLEGSESESGKHEGADGAESGTEGEQQKIDGALEANTGGNPSADENSTKPGEATIENESYEEYREKLKAAGIDENDILTIQDMIDMGKTQEEIDEIIANAIPIDLDNPGETDLSDTFEVPENVDKKDFEEIVRILTVKSGYNHLYAGRLLKGDKIGRLNLTPETIFEFASEFIKAESAVDADDYNLIKIFNKYGVK